MNIRYYKEKALYDNGILELQGWLYDEYEEPFRLYLVLITKSGIEEKRELSKISRKDVQKAFSLASENVGFSFKGTIGNIVAVHIFLEIDSNQDKTRIDIGEFAGDESDISKENLKIAYSDKNNFLDIRNFKNLKCYDMPKCVDRTVDVIVPVYNGYEYLDVLFRSLYGTKIPTRIIVINDCSPDKRVDQFFESLCREKRNIIYVKNETNLGFVKSVNIGLKLSQNDVAIVNTDIEVPEKWLERLMKPIFENKNVASTTPYTNCGTLCSFPDMGKDNDIFDNRTVVFVDSVFRKLRPSYTEMPTGVGFCMGMSKSAIEEVGLLDEKSFEKGYGEENDWCQRAIDSGYKNVHVENLFVYHKHGGSFPSQEKEKLMEQNTRRLTAKHPDYMADVARYFQNDNNKMIRSYALFMCLMQTNAKTCIAFNHVLGGGANYYLQKQKEQMIDDDWKYLEFAYNVYENHYQVEIRYHKYQISIFSEKMEELLAMVDLSAIDKIVINELVTFPDLFNLLDQIVKLKECHGAELTMLIHDFYCVCPTINLLSQKGEYCKLNCKEKKNACLVDNTYLCDSQYCDYLQWQEHWKNFLEACTDIIAFSDNSKKILEDIYGILERVIVVPHVTDKMLPVTPKCKIGSKLNIGVLGVLNNQKGLSIVKEMLKRIESGNLPINIIVIGTCEEDLQSQSCIVTGSYAREGLPGLMYLYDIDIVFIASVCPETFSYTTEEAIKMCLPVATFNLGAPAERVQKYDQGWIIPEMNVDSALETMQKFMRKTKRVDLNKKIFKVLFIVEYFSFSSRYRVEHFRENLAVRGIYSSVEKLQEMDPAIVGQYDAVSIYRCSQAKKVKKVVREAHKYRVPVIYDIDDYIFDYDAIKDMEFLKDEEYEDFELYSENIKKCMGVSDYFTTSTHNLKAAIERCFPEKKTILCRNSANMEMRLLSEIAIEKADRSDEKIVLGYFSGSKTHNKDWELIEDIILNIMQENSSIQLILGGVLKISDRLTHMDNRIHRFPFMDWRKLPYIICQIDINLMPLENNFFQWCKSENKWMEAGLVKVPTIASRNPELEGVLDDGKDVLLCGDALEWKEKIQLLINDEKMRKQIGDNAHVKVYQKYLSTGNENYEEVLQLLLKHTD